jgi:DNA-directed RNA polymerase specialized sigma24 family protein
MAEVTQILDAIDQGDPSAAEQLLPLVYEELRALAARKLAQEKPGQTLQATALVHEAYLRLVSPPAPPSQGGKEPGSPLSSGGEGSGVKGAHAAHWASRGHFFAAAAEAMRRILVEQARRKRARKRGGGGWRFELSEADRIVIPDPDTLLTVNEALEELAREDPGSAAVARLRLFAGLSIEEAAAALGVSRATAFRDWSYARACLTSALSGGKKTENP